MAEQTRVPCRCLLADNWPELHRTVAEYVALLPEEQRVSGDIYQARLAVCGQCPHLRDGTCALCGCYVEARAAKKGQKCPDVPARWEKSD